MPFGSFDVEANFISKPFSIDEFTNKIDSILKPKRTSARGS